MAASILLSHWPAEQGNCLRWLFYIVGPLRFRFLPKNELTTESCLIILISVNVSLMSALAGEVSFGNPMWEYLVYQYFLINHALSQVSGKEHFFINELRKENFIIWTKNQERGV